MNKKGLFAWGLMALMFLALVSMPAYAGTVTYNTSLGGPGAYNGSGNPDGNWTSFSNGAGLRLSLRAEERFVGPLTPTGANYTAPTGPGAGGFAKWNFRFDVMTNTSVSNYTYLLTLTDITTSNSFAFNPTLIPDNSYWNGSSKSVGLFSANSNALGFQNSENLSWLLPGFNPSALDIYSIALQGIDNATGQTSSVEITVNDDRTTVPEPVSFSLVGIGLTGLAVARRRLGLA